MLTIIAPMKRELAGLRRALKRRWPGLVVDCSSPVNREGENGPYRWPLSPREMGGIGKVPSAGEIPPSPPLPKGGTGSPPYQRRVVSPPFVKGDLGGFLRRYLPQSAQGEREGRGGDRIGGRGLISVSELLELYVVGIGKERTRASIKKLLGSRQGSAQDGLLLLGFAGGIDPALKNGDLVLSNRYYQAAGARNPPNPPLRKGGLREPILLNGEPGNSSLSRKESEKPHFDKGEPGKSPFGKGGFRGISLATTEKYQDFLEPDGNMRRQAIEAARDAGLSVSQGDSLTVEGIIATPEAKKDLCQQYGVCAVNMEDYWAAEAAAQAGVPFLAVRAVLDPAFQGLPYCLIGVSEQPGRVALQALARPWQAAGLLRLGRQAQAAQASLARFALAFIDYRLSARERQPTSSR